MGDIGKKQTEREYEPIEVPEIPMPVPAPREPEKVPVPA